MTHPRLPLLFSPVHIGGVEIPNRIALAPMATGGVGLIIMEVTGVDALHPYVPRTVGLWSDDLIPGYRELTGAVHAHGARIMPQIAHPGPDSLSSLLTGVEAVGPTAGIVNGLTKTGCRELTREEIREIPGQFAEAARRAREAGCDGIELHAAHAYMLVGSFLSALRNRRTDEYGGSMEGRMRFPLEVISAIRARVGRDFPIILRISADELVTGGRDLRETLSIAPLFVEAGVDAFHVSSGAYPDLAWRVIPPTGTPLALNAAFSAALKRAVDVPVMVVGRVTDPRLAEDIVARGEADVVVMGRALLADPDLPAKAARGELEDIAPCIGCGLGCVTARERGGDMTCLVNPRLGREPETALVPARAPKKILVAGGGPAGLMAAWTAAARGHRVVLCERDARLGGQYNLAAVAPGKQELTRVIRYLARQRERSGVQVRLSTEVTPDLVAGGGEVGLETAEDISFRGDSLTREAAEVLVVEMREAVGMDMFDEARVLLMERLRARGVGVLTSARLAEITADGAVVERAGGRETLGGYDWIVLAFGARPRDGLARAAGGPGRTVITVGDAREPGQAVAAIASGYEAGRSIA